MLSCKEISQLVSQSLDRKLPLWTRMQLWMHLWMCRLCWGFRKDLRHLQAETRQQSEEIERAASASEAKLPEDARARIKRVLEMQQQ